MRKKERTLAEVSLHVPNPMHLRAQQTLKAHVFNPKKGKGSWKRRPKHREVY